MAEYTLLGAKWPTSNVTWSFAATNYGPDSLSPFSNAISGAYENAVRWAFQQWSSVALLVFTEGADSPDYSHAADIRIGFGDLDTPATGVIGQTSLRTDGAGDLVPDEIVRLEDPGQLGLVPNGNDDFTYIGTATTLRQVALHEIGHALGLGHASDPYAAMYFQVGPSNQTLDQTDIAGIQSLYGASVVAPGASDGPPSSSEPKVLVLHLAEDAWQGDAQFTVSVDGQTLGGAQSVTALHSQGQDQAFTFQGQFDVGPHDLAIAFINDAWGGTPDTDRNLYVAEVDYDGAHVANSSAALYSAGTWHVQFGGSAGDILLPVGT